MDIILWMSNASVGDKLGEEDKFDEYCNSSIDVPRTS